MPASKAQQRATNKYIAKAYDRINLTVPKGKKDTIQAHAEALGQSVNGFINSAIDQAMAQKGGEVVSEGRQGASEGRVISLQPEALEVAQQAAEAAGEDLTQFVTRAVGAQAQRDKDSLQFGIDPATGGKLEKEA